MRQQHPPVREAFHSNNTRRRTAATASCSTLGGQKANCHPSGSSKADVSTITHQKEARATHGVPKSHHTQRQGLLFNSPLNENTCFGFLGFLPGGITSWILGFLRWMLLVLLFSFDICHLRVHPCSSPSLFVFLFFHWTLTCSRSPPPTCILLADPLLRTWFPTDADLNFSRNTEDHFQTDLSAQRALLEQAGDVCSWCVSFPSSLCSFCCIVLFGISFRTSKVFAEGLVVLFLSPCYYKVEVGIKPNCVAQCDSWQQPDFSVSSSVTLLL